MLLDDVIRAPDGVPTGWRLLRMGDNPMNWNGRELSLNLTPEAAASAAGYFKTKGQKIPLDSRHFVYFLANQLKVDEAEVAALLPDGRGVFAFGDLESRPDGLWITNLDYVPLGRDLMKQGVFRYFSPGLRGIDPETMTPILDADDPFRITSCALENEPALNHIPELAGSADDSGTGVTLSAVNQSIRRITMTKLEKALAKLLGKTTVALAADGGGDANAAADAVEALAALLATIRTALQLGPESTPEEVGKAITGVQEKLAGGDELIGKIKAALGLKAEATPAEVEGALAGTKQNAENTAALSAQVKALVEKNNATELDGLIEKGLASGQLSKDMADTWARKQTCAALSSFLEVALPAVPVEERKTEVTRRETTAALSASNREIYSKLGIKPEEVKNAE